MQNISIACDGSARSLSKMVRIVVASLSKCKQINTMQLIRTGKSESITYVSQENHGKSQMIHTYDE